MPVRAGDSRYWDGVAARADRYYLPRALAEYKMGEYAGLLTGWDIGRCQRAVITDLYESSFGEHGLCDALATRAAEVLGLDISPVICRTARGSLSSAGRAVTVVCGDARRMPLADGSVDLVLSPSTFDHFPEIDAALRECARVLRPGGKLVLALNSADNPLYRPGVRLAERFKRREYRTDHFYTVRQISALLSRAGFRAVRGTAIMHVPVGMTTVIELLQGSMPALLGRAGDVLIGACRAWGRNAGRMKLLTGWWAAAEGVKD